MDVNYPGDKLCSHLWSDFALSPLRVEPKLFFSHSLPFANLVGILKWQVVMLVLTSMVVHFSLEALLKVSLNLNILCRPNVILQ